MFTGLFRMNARCPHCDLQFEREPGYFLGSIYINYGLTALLTAVGYTVLRFGYGFDARTLLYGFLTFCVLMPTFFFRYARALWLALDCRFEKDAFFHLAPSPGQPVPPPPSEREP